MLADDGSCYVVKFLNNPQGARVLANEWIAGRLAQAIGLPVPDFDVIDVSQDLIRRSPGLVVRGGGQTQPCTAGRHFASRLPTANAGAPIFDDLPLSTFALVSNAIDFVGALVLDKWTCNADARQVVFCRLRGRKPIRMYLIDHGFCFNAEQWNFPDSPARGGYVYPSVYYGVTGWESFEPWLGRVENFDEGAIYAIGDAVPPEWYNGQDDLQRLLGQLVKRRAIVRRLIWEFKNNSRAPFPHWFEQPKRAAYMTAA